MAQVALLVFPALMAYAAVSDLLTMKIPNWLTGCLVLAFLLIALGAGLDISALLNHAAAGLLLLLAGMAMFAARWMGGGDAKLLAGVALWFGISTTLVDFLLLASIAGGALTLAILAMRRLPLPAFTLTWDWLQRLHNRKTGIPYGIALAGAALAVYPNSGVWSVLLDLAR
jgi:prepilin peptidase CpaA